MSQLPGEPHVVALTPRLRIRHFTVADAPFILRLLNEPTFIENIADRGVRSEDDAREYLASGPMASYTTHGHGLNAVERRDTGAPIGMCGLLKRDSLAWPDLGYALLPEFAGEGFAREAAEAVMRDAEASFGYRRIVAIVNSTNARSIGLLTRLGFRHEAPMTLPSGAEVERYGWAAPL